MEKARCGDWHKQPDQKKELVLVMESKNDNKVLCIDHPKITSLAKDRMVGRIKNEKTKSERTLIKTFQLFTADLQIFRYFYAKFDVSHREQGVSQDSGLLVPTGGCMYCRETFLYNVLSPLCLSSCPGDRNQYDSKSHLIP